MNKTILKTMLIGGLLILILGFFMVTPLRASPPPASLIVFSYTLEKKNSSPDQNERLCKLNGYLGGSIYVNKYGAEGKLNSYTTCFFSMWDEKTLSFYIAKTYNGLNGVILPGDKLRLKYSPVPGNVQPKNIGAGDACLSPWVLTDSQLTAIINQTIREQIPDCKI
jgi:hypothetical protein